MLKNFFFFQVSGIRVLYDLKKPNYKRVESVEIRCADCPIPKYEKLDESQIYRVVTNSYVKEGGDGFQMIKENILAQDNSQILDIDVLRAYFQRMEPIWIGLEDRIRFSDGISLRFSKFFIIFCFIFSNFSFIF